MSSQLEADKSAMPPTEHQSVQVVGSSTSLEGIVPDSSHHLRVISAEGGPHIPPGAEPYSPTELYPQEDDYWRKLQAIHIPILGLSESELADFGDFLQKLFEEILDTLSSPEKLAPILTEVAIVSPGLYFCWKLIQKTQGFAKKGLISELVSKCREILRYFEKVPESRIKEISRATKIPVGELRPLLQVLRFEHGSSCFWTPPKSVSRSAAVSFRSTLKDEPQDTAKS